MTFHDLLPLLYPIRDAAIMAIGLFIAMKTQKPKDHERAELIARIAASAAALAVSKWPSSTPAALVQRVVEALINASGLTKNRAVLERAATKAVLDELARGRG